MEARLSAIQRGLFLLLAASVAVAVLARPAPENRRYVRALEEVSRFRTAFDQQALEHSLREQASTQGQVSLQPLNEPTRNKRGPKLKVAQKAAPVAALASVSLSTLSQVAAHARPESSVAIGMADLEALDSSLSWRLARSQRPGEFTVSSVELLPAQVTTADVTLEREVAELRTASLDARAALEAAESRIGILEYRVEAQTKHRSKALYKSRLALEEAQLTLQQKTQERSDVQQRYDQAAQRAERPRKLSSATNLSQMPSVAIARVKYTYDAEESTLDIPIPLTRRDVRIAPLRITQFPALRAASLWSVVKDQRAEQAMTTIRGRFNWHFASFTVLGLELEGTLLLALLPCILPALLALLLMRIRRAEVSYSPFGAKVPRSLPMVGFKNRFLDFVVIILLPLFAVGMAAVSLVLNDRVPIIPALTAVACVTLGVYAFAEVRALREQTQSIVRHSYPPQAGPGE